MVCVTQHYTTVSKSLWENSLTKGLRDSWSHGVQSLMGDPVLGSQFHGVQSFVCDPVLGSWFHGVQSLVGSPAVFRLFARNTAEEYREAASCIAATMEKKRNKG